MKLHNNDREKNIEKIRDIVYFGHGVYDDSIVCTVLTPQATEKKYLPSLYV
jgi:hypothetical protein